jgi:hypothetical protein
MVDSTVHFSGPLFDARFDAAMSDIVDQAQVLVAGAVLERVHFFLDGSIKHPTPYYETQITQQHRGAFVVVHDRGIVYGPWLEGTSSRNATTRFKGYASFRKATQVAQKLAPAIVARVVARNLGRLG